MKILMTGATSLQVKPPEARRAAVVKIDVPGAVVDVMREAGHTVDWRAVTPGEDLSSYDFLWICVAGVNSVNATPGAIGMLWAMAQEHIPAVVFLDDWKTQLTYQQAKNFSKSEDENIYYDRHLLSGIRKFVPDGNPTHYTFESAETEYARCCAEYAAAGGDPDELPKPTPFYAQRLEFSAAEWAAMKPTVVEGARAMLRGRKNSIVGIPAYRWGSTDVVLPTLPAGVREQTICRLDPSFIAVDIANRALRSASRPNRKDEWRLAALGDHTDWLDRYLPNRTWPVEAVGHNSNRKLKTELDVVRFYDEGGAILSPTYYHAGSGWWRSRFVYAAALTLPIYAVDREAEPLGRAYLVDPYELEKMHPNDRHALAVAQRNTLAPLLSSREEFASQVDDMIKLAVG